MTLAELVKQVFPGDSLVTKSIGIYNGDGVPIYPDFADEVLETHGSLTVIDWCLSNRNLLVVQLKKEEH